MRRRVDLCDLAMCRAVRLRLEKLNSTLATDLYYTDLGDSNLKLERFVLCSRVF